MNKEIKVKSLIVKPISKAAANTLCRRWHYSGKVDSRSQIHLGVFHNNMCYGIMQFGPSIYKKKIIGIVKGTRWNGFLELNRMAFSDELPKNSESRCLAMAFKIIKKRYPFIKWIISYSDATQSGDGAIYRATSFKLTAINKNKSMIRTKNGDVICSLIMSLSSTSNATKKRYGFRPGLDTLKSWMDRDKLSYLPGYQLRYIKFLNPEAEKDLTVPIIPYSKIPDEVKMYKGIKRIEHESNAAISQMAEGGAVPTDALHNTQYDSPPRCL